MFDYDAILNQLYTQGLSRQPDQGGMDYWRSQMPRLQGGNTQTVTPQTLQAFYSATEGDTGNDRAAFSSYLNAPTDNSSAGFDKYRALAGMQSQQLNSMPGVYDYNGPVQHYTDDEMSSLLGGLKKRIGGLGGLGGKE